MIRQRGNRFQVRVYAGRDPRTGKRRHLYGTAPNRRAAGQLENELNAQAARITPATATLDHLLDRWLEVARHAPSTRHVIVGQLNRHVRPDLGALNIADVTTERLDRYYVQLEREGLGPGSIRRLHGNIKAAFAQAVRWGWLDRNPATGARLPAQPHPVPVFPPRDQLRRLLENAPDDFARFLRLVAVTGMRRGEACALRRTDLDLDAGVIRKARAISHGVERQTKTGARYGIAVGPSTVETLRTQLADMDTRASELGVTCPPDAFVFSDEPDCSRPWTPDAVTHRMHRLSEKLGIEPPVRLKDLRDFMVTSLLESGQSVRTAAGRAGHARATTTLTHYAAWVPASDAAAADQLDALLDE